MIPGDTDDIRHDYEVLLNELATYNPEMLQKRRVVAITKADLLDDELIQLLSADLPQDVPLLFISAVTGFHITELKDLLWHELEQLHLHDNVDLTAEAPVHHASLVHRDKDISEFDELGDVDDFVDTDDLEIVDDFVDLDDDIEYVDL